MLTQSCSTLPSPAEIKPAKAELACLPPQAYANWSSFTSTTKVVRGETAFESVKRFKLAEAEKNKAGQRLWGGLKACRAGLSNPPATPKPQEEPNALAQLLK